MKLRILNFVQRLALSYWLGEMLFFIIVFAPRVFSVLARPDAARLQAAIFPAYFTGGVVAGVFFLLASLGVYAKSLPGARRAYRFVFALGLLALAVFIYSRWWITPEISALQPSVLDANVSPELRAQFDHLHKLSVQLNGGALIFLLGILFLL